MSARPEQVFTFRPMNKADVDAIMPLERALYPFPWTPGNFTDSLSAGYSCWVYEFGSIEARNTVANMFVRPWSRAM